MQSPDKKLTISEIEAKPKPVDRPIEESHPAKRHSYLKFIIILITLFLIFAVGGGLLLFFQQKNFTKISKQDSPLDNPLVLKLAEKLPIPKITLVQITLTPTNILSSQPPIQPSPTVPPLPQNWNTYNNSSLNFSLSYPSVLIINEKSHGLGVTEISLTGNTSPDPEVTPDYQILIYPKAIGKLIGQDFDQYYTLAASSTQSMTSDASSPQQFTKIRNFKINELRAFEFRTTSDPPDPFVEGEIGTYIEIDGSTLIISTGESNKSILDHMIASFKHST